MTPVVVKLIAVLVNLPPRSSVFLVSATLQFIVIGRLV